MAWRRARSFRSSTRRHRMRRTPMSRSFSCEMQIDALHRNHLAITAASRASIYAHTGPQRGLSKGETNRLSDTRECVRQTDTRRRLSLARRGRSDRRDQYESRLTFQSTRPVEDVEIDLRDITPVGVKILLGEPEITSHIHDRSRRCLSRNLHIRLHRALFSFSVRCCLIIGEMHRIFGLQTDRYIVPNRHTRTRASRSERMRHRFIQPDSATQYSIIPRACEPSWGDMR
jgi:hypothetical protein